MFGRGAHASPRGSDLASELVVARIRFRYGVVIEFARRLGPRREPASTWAGSRLWRVLLQPETTEPRCPTCSFEVETAPEPEREAPSSDWLGWPDETILPLVTPCHRETE